MYSYRNSPPLNCQWFIVTRRNPIRKGAGLPRPKHGYHGPQGRGKPAPLRILKKMDVVFRTTSSFSHFCCFGLIAAKKRYNYSAYSLAVLAASLVSNTMTGAGTVSSTAESVEGLGEASFSCGDG